MDVTKAEKTRLGVFVVGTLAVLAVILFFMVGKRLLARTDTYFTRLEESVGGLDLGTSVKQNGVDIGSVTSIGTDSSDITKSIVRFEVRKGVPMKWDMVATLGSFGITGLKYIEITGGSYNSPDIPPGGEVKSELSTFGKITVRADSIAHKVDVLLGNFVAITGADNRDNINALVQSSISLSQSLDTMVQDINDMDAAKKMTAILTQFDATVKELRAKIKNTEVEETVKEYQKAAKGLNDVTQRVDITVLKIQEDLTQTMSNMRETMRNMNAFSRQIRENPSVLLRGEDKKERIR